MAHSDQLHDDLMSMVGVWRDHLRAYDPRGLELSHDEHGGAPGAFPYENLVYCDFDGRTWTQTNVVLSGREPHQRTFTASVAEGMLRFDHLGPEAPQHVGVSGGPGIIWFVAEDSRHDGLTRYAEPDIIRIEGDRRWRDTVLWRNGELRRIMHVEGERVSSDGAVACSIDPRGSDVEPHGQRSVTTNYRSAGRSPVGADPEDAGESGPTQTFSQAPVQEGTND